MEQRLTDQEAWLDSMEIGVLDDDSELEEVLDGLLRGGSSRERTADEGQYRERGDTEMIGRLMGKEEVNAALVVALSGTIMALAANGPGPVSLGRIVSGTLSNPVPKGAAGTRRSSSIPTPRQQVAA